MDAPSTVSLELPV